MIQEIILFIQSFLVSYGTWAFFLLGFMEEVLFLIPSGLLFLAIGFFAIGGAMPFGSALALAFGPIAFAGSAGVLLGASLMYGLAYWGGKPLILKFGAYCGVKWQDVEKMQRFFGRGYTDEAVLIALRAIPIFPISVVSLLCGAVRIRPFVFIVITFVGTIFRVGTLALFGWYVGREFSFYAEKIAFFEQVVLFAAVIACIVFFIIRIKRRKLPTIY